MTLSTGQILQNRYRIVSLLGQGGMGAVYRAWDLNLSIPVAVKENLDATPNAQKQFLREAQFLARLSHPNLPRVIDHFVFPGQGQYLVMDYVDGEDLQTLLQKNGRPLPERQVLEWILQICEALHYLHNQSPPIIHRDIKPANIRIHHDTGSGVGKAMLVDFGIAKTYDPQVATTAGARAVTPGYSPLEQYGHGVTDTRTDIYAIGATLYTLLTGQPLPESVKRAASSAPLTLPRQLNAAISPGMESVILRAVELAPENRFPDIAHMRSALRRSFGSASGSPRVQPVGAVAAPNNASPAAAPLVQKKKSSQRRWLVPLVIIFFLLGAGVLAGGYYLLNQESPSGAGTSSDKATSTIGSPGGEKMTGGFRLAVAGFAVSGDGANPDTGVQVADEIVTNLQLAFADRNPSILPVVWGPDKAGMVVGITAEERLANASALAEEIEADLVVYGMVRMGETEWEVTPEFLVATRSFELASEVVGPGQLGKPFTVYGDDDATRRAQVSTRMAENSLVLSRIVLGMMYLSGKDYERAVTELQAVESLPGWPEYQGKQTPYLLLGNAALREKDMALARLSYQRSIDENPDYARPYIGLGSTYYIEATTVFSNTGSVEQTLALLDQAEQFYRMAAEAPEQPAIADVPVRVSFGLGHCAYVRALVNESYQFEEAITYLNEVIAAYDQGSNPRLRELAAESHARLAAIFELNAQPSQAAQEYYQAYLLFYDDPVRQARFEERWRTLQAYWTPPP